MVLSLRGGFIAEAISLMVEEIASIIHRQKFKS